MLTMCNDQEYIPATLQAGADGYVLKKDAPPLARIAQPDYRPIPTTKEFKYLDIKVW